MNDVKIVSTRFQTTEKRVFPIFSSFLLTFKPTTVPIIKIMFTIIFKINFPIEKILFSSFFLQITNESKFNSKKIFI